MVWAVETSVTLTCTPFRSLPGLPTCGQPQAEWTTEQRIQCTPGFKPFNSVTKSKMPYRRSRTDMYTVPQSSCVYSVIFLLDTIDDQVHHLLWYHGKENKRWLMVKLLDN